MNEDAMGMLRAIYETLLVHQRNMFELMCATKALVTALESNPKLNDLYQRQYAVLANGPTRPVNEQVIAQLEATIRKLTVQ